MDAKRFLSIRLSQEELQDIQRQYKSSGCRSLTQFVKKVLLNKPGHFKMFKLMQLLVFIQSKLDKIDNTLNVITKEQLRQNMADIKSQTNQFYRNWPH